MNGVDKGLKGLGLDIKLKWFKLVPLYLIFFNSKEERITPRRRTHIAEPRKLFVYVCDWCVFSYAFSKLVFRIKDW